MTGWQPPIVERLWRLAEMQAALAGLREAERHIAGRALESIAAGVTGPEAEAILAAVSKVRRARESVEAEVRRLQDR